MKILKNFQTGKYSKIYLGSLIFLVAFFFRFYRITAVPISLNWDETAFGYNAYSILKTGKDEYGTRFPLAFKSVGDYKCPLFVYFLVPVIKIFGLNEFSIRLLPSLFGALAVVVFFLAVEELFPKSRITFLSAFLLAISPWHLQFTRAGADVAISTFFLILGIWLFLKAANSKKTVILSLSFSAFVATFYSYYGERFFSPLILILLIFFFKEEVLKSKKRFLISLIAPGFLLLPLVGSLLSAGHQSKVLMTTIFGYKRPQEYLAKVQDEDYFPLVFNLFHNSAVEYSLMVADRYLNHFSPNFLFIKGLNDDRQKIFGMGMLYWSDVIWLIFAFFALKRITKEKKAFYFVLWWLLISPLPSIITRDPVHARRAFNMVYPISIFLAVGVDRFFEYLKEINKLKAILLSVFIAVFFSWSFSLYMLSYYIFTPLRTYEGPGGWQYGYKQLVEFVSPLKANYNQIVVDTSYQGPYLYFLFYEKYSPADYQKQAVLIKKDEMSLGEGKGYDKYEFRDIYWPVDRGLKKTLFAGSPERLSRTDIDPKQARIIKTIYFPDGKIAYYVVETY